MHIPVDDKYNAAHNELYRDAKRLKLSAAVLAALLAAGTIALIWMASGAVGIIFAIIAGLGTLMCLALIPLLDQNIGSPEDNFNHNPLVPAIVAKVSPRDGTLLALVNTAIDPEDAPQWALATRTITRLNGSTPKLGTRVPSVAMRGKSRSKDTFYTQVSPMPVDWATPDKAVVKDAGRAISHAEWTRLEGMRDRVDEVLATPNNLLLL